MTLVREEVDIPGAPARGYYVSPEKPRAAMVVAHEIFGRMPELERVCDRLAEAGYATLMPDLFGDGFRPVCISRAMREIASGKGPSVEVLKAAGDVVATRSGVGRDRVGVIGFCMGGGFALVVGRAFAVTSTNYGEVPDVETLRGIGPTIGCYGGRDRMFRGKAPLLEERLKQLGVPHEVRVYDAGHAFLSEGDHPVAAAFTRLLMDVDPVRDTPARDQGWKDILAFLERHLVQAT